MAKEHIQRNSLCIILPRAWQRGAMERYTISFVQGAVQMFGFMASFVLTTYLAGGFIERREG